MDQIQTEEINWRGMPAWQLTAEKLEAIVMVTGGHIAGLRTPGDDLNPMWQPPWTPCEPEDAPGNPDFPDSEGTLLCTIVGLNLCIDRFGGPWPGETRPVHGEAGAVRWTLDDSNPAVTTLRCTLPEATLSVARSFSFDGETLTVSTQVARTDGQAAEIEWAEHLTVGDPFLENAQIEASVDGAWMSDLDDPELWRFKGAQPLDSVDPELSLAMPAPDAQPAGDVITARATKGRAAVIRPDLNKALRIEWEKEEFPWLCVWTQHNSRTGAPWLGRTRAKGLEFSTKPFPEGKPPASRATEFQGRPATCRIPAGETLTRSFTLKWGSAS